MKAARWLVIVGCVLSLGTALLHGAGFRAVSAEIGGTNAPPVLGGVFKCLWLIISVQFIIMSVIGMVAMGSTRGKQVVLLCAVIALCDAGLMLHFVGPFFGVYCVAAVAVFLLAGGLLLPEAVKS